MKASEFSGVYSWSATGLRLVCDRKTGPFLARVFRPDSQAGAAVHLPRQHPNQSRRPRHCSGERGWRCCGRRLSRHNVALLRQQRQDRYGARRHTDRSHRQQTRRQVLRRAQQRVRLRQLRDHPCSRGVKSLGTGGAPAVMSTRRSPAPWRRKLLRSYTGTRLVFEA